MFGTGPVAELDVRFGAPDAEPTPWDTTLRVIGEAELFWIATVRDSWMDSCASRRDSRTQHLDRARHARRVGQVGVGGEEDTFERFGQRDVCSVVSREVVAQLPTARQ